MTTGSLTRCMLAGAMGVALALGQVALADDSAALQALLRGTSALEASFEQVVQRHNGTVQRSTGVVALQRPQRFMLHTAEPDELVLFTREDGVYYYDPFVNQLSIYPLTRLDSSPFALLTGDSETVWARYEVKKQGSSYVLTPTERSEIKSLKLEFKNNKISSIVINLPDGSTNTYTLHSPRDTLTAGIFDYHIPKDAEVDDERQR